MNEYVKNFCNKNNIRLHFIPKGSPWLQAFIERGGFGTNDVTESLIYD